MEINMNKKQTGRVIAVAVGALFATASMAQNDNPPTAPTQTQVTVTTPAANTVPMKCLGGNACRGMSACAASGNACRGKNSCKGQGYSMSKTAEECRISGGTIESPVR
jgi:hypothetical protein